MKTTKEIARRAEELVRRMTTEEKLRVIVETAEAVERLGIPKYYHGNEALHGVVRPGRYTVFPQAIALGAMFDDTFLEEIADAISTESRAAYHNGPEPQDAEEWGGRYNGLLTFWSPDLNLARDPRWGRTAETYGEDPYLAGKNGAAFVRGLQGNDPTCLKAVATPKHFTANNEEHNRFTCNAVMSEKTLREYHLEPFRMAVQEGHAEAVMGAYNAVNGVPCHASRRLLTEILRDEWGFDGYVVSDCSGVGRIWDAHNYVKEPEEAASTALNAGVDLECGGYAEFEHFYREFLQKQLSSGAVTEERIDEAARRVLTARIKLGQLDGPGASPWAALPRSVIGCEKHRKMSYLAAVRSAVLLKNNGILPLKKNCRVAVVGNNAACVQFGDYSGKPKNAPVSPYEGIRALAGENAALVPWNFEADDDAFAPVPPAAFACGAEGSYYGNDFFGGEPANRTDPNIDFTWEAQAPDPMIKTAAFSVIWRGELLPPTDGDYYFSVQFSGSAKCCPPEFYIDGEKVQPEEPVPLKANKPVSFLLRYRKNTDAPSVRLTWKKPKRAPETLFAREIGAARNADAVIAVVGLGTNYESEGRDKTDLSLPAEQISLLQAVKAVNGNLIVVLENGSALAIPWIAENAAAILEAWYPGEQGGTALADLIYGNVSPSGRLPLSFPAKTEDLPPFDDYEMDHGRTYMYNKVPPLYPFGFGLSYTTFRYYDLRADRTGASVTVENTGGMDAEEVAQLYIDSAGYPGQPKVRLKGFRRIALKAGESRRVEFTLTDESFSLFDEAGTRRVLPGTYGAYIGGGLPDEQSERAIVEIG